jgi:hypothetical protein
MVKKKSSFVLLVMVVSVFLISYLLPVTQVIVVTPSFSDELSLISE